MMSLGQADYTLSGCCRLKITPWTSKVTNLSINHRGFDRNIRHFFGQQISRSDQPNTVNVEIFALYIFSLNSRFLNIRKNIILYTVKITIILSY